ncbi:hypothetical protein ACLOAV_004340 [Pseudogymnoascus australis]
MGIRCMTRKLVSTYLSPGDLDLGPCSIEQYVAKKDPFRVAPTGKIPVSWPHDDKTHHFTGDRYTVFNEALEDSFPAAEDQTVIFFTLDTETDTSRWQEAVDYIYEMVNEAAAKAGKTMGVELENPFNSCTDISSTICPGTSLYRSLLQIEPVVLAEVRKLCPGVWTSIAYHNRQNKFAVTVGVGIQQPTVIVYVMPGSLASWGEVEAHIRRAIEAVPVEEDVEIALDILPGFNNPSTAPSKAYTPTTSHHPRFQFDIPHVPILGASIGPQLSDTDSGSLGAIVNFHPRGGGEPRKCFLTAYHVIASGDPIGRAVNDEHGIGLDGRAVDRRIEIASPACCDGEHTKEKLAGFVKTSTNPKKSCYAELVAFIEREGVIGEVIHASGLRYSSAGDRRCRMDWALVALHPAKDGVLNLPPSASRFSHPYSDHEESPPYNYYTKPGDVISRSGELTAFSWAAKFDRGAWGTTGQVNGMKRTVCWGDGVVSKEVEVIPLEFSFAEGGDDGSMVFNAKKEWVGMVVGGDSEYAGYVTPAANIIADIEARTGGTITLV